MVNGMFLEGPAALNIQAKEPHHLEAITDCVALCTHIARFANGEEFPFGFEADEMQWDEAVNQL